MRVIRNIVIHCTAGYGDVASIKKFWSSVLGWKAPGYHYFVYEDGSVEQLASLSQVTNGVRGFNSHSVHIAYQGGVERGNVKRAKDTRTPQQKQAIKSTIQNVLLQLKQYQDTSSIQIKGHRDFSPDTNGNGVVDSWERIKECPSFDAIPEYKGVINKLAVLILSILLLGGASCKSSRSVQTERIVFDTTTVTVTNVERDTILIAPADSAHLFWQLPLLHPIQSRGLRNAKITAIPKDRGTLVICECDSLAIAAKLRDKYVDKHRNRVETVTVSKTVYRTPKFIKLLAMSGGLALLFLVVIILLQLIKILK